MEIIEERYSHHSTTIVSQLPTYQWYERIGDNFFAEAEDLQYKR